MAETKRVKKMQWKGKRYYIIQETEDFFFLSEKKDKTGVFVVKKDERYTR